jgi:hypothetical protein
MSVGRKLNGICHQRWCKSNRSRRRSIAELASCVHCLLPQQTVLVSQQDLERWGSQIVQWGRQLKVLT